MKFANHCETEANSSEQNRTVPNSAKQCPTVQTCAINAMLCYFLAIHHSIQQNFNSGANNKSNDSLESKPCERIFFNGFHCRHTVIDCKIRSQRP